MRLRLIAPTADRETRRFDTFRSIEKKRAMRLRLVAPTADLGTTVALISLGASRSCR